MLLRTTPQNALDHSKVSQQILAAFVVIDYFSIYHRYIFYPFYVRKDKKIIAKVAVMLKSHRDSTSGLHHSRTSEGGGLKLCKAGVPGIQPVVDKIRRAILPPNPTGEFKPRHTQHRSTPCDSSVWL